MMDYLPVTVKKMISATFEAFKEGPFVTKTVGELMWGYNSKLVDFLNTIFPGLMPFKGKFGLFVEFNNSNTGLFTIFTGKDDINVVHKVDSWNGLKKVNYWKSEQCNMINGTAGQMWPPFMTTESTLPFYSPDACRSMELVYERPGTSQGIPVYHYVAPKTLFANGSDYPPNEGFCPCRQSGLLDVRSCRHSLSVSSVAEGTKCFGSTIRSQNFLLQSLAVSGVVLPVGDIQSFRSEMVREEKGTDHLH
ncbi:scavenger receptor class B member 1 [Tachysurus ichikawai]